jgi:hypothetical protein
LHASYVSTRAADDLRGRTPPRSSRH